MTDDNDSDDEEERELGLNTFPQRPPEGHDRAVGNSGGYGTIGNDNAVGNSGGAPPEGNQNAATHHLKADPDNVLQYLEKHEPDNYEWVMAKYRSYLEDAPFDEPSAKADQLLQVAVREYSIWKATGMQVREEIVKKTHIKGSDGELAEVEKEHPVNQPLDRMESQVTRRLKELDVLDSPDSQAADAMKGLSSDEYVIEVDSETVDDAADAETESSDD